MTTPLNPRELTLALLAQLLGVSIKELEWLACQGRHVDVAHYRHRFLPKRSGGFRLISSPKARMRAAQARLFECVLASVPAHPAAMAFRPGVSITNNARAHAGQGLVIRLDLRNFFPSISRQRVTELFVALGYSQSVAAALAGVTTEQFVKKGMVVGRAVTGLPQGACTSPAIANLAACRLDERLSMLSLERGFTYTRYADDLTFSHPDGGLSAWDFIERVSSIVMSEGFQVNERKTRVMRAHQRQVVTGLTVNREPISAPRVPRRDARNFRSFLHQCRRDGWEAVSERMGFDAFMHAQGYLAFVNMVNPEQAARLRKGLPPCERADARDSGVPF